MPLNQSNLSSAPRVLEVTRIIMRGVVPINSQLLVLISAPASDERSGASRRPNYRVPGVLVPAPPLTRVMCPTTLSISGGAVHVPRYLHTLSALLSIYPCSFQTISFIICILGVFLHFEDPLPLHWGLYEIIPDWHK